MNQRAEYLIQIFEHIGSPLMGSILRASNEANPEQDAQAMAALLSKTVELSISMANMAELSSVENDAVRVALAALASPLIGTMHEQNKQTPSDNDLKRINSALQAVLTFSENFTPDAENTQRLDNIQARGVGADSQQINIQYMQAFIPAVNEIGAFSFGQPEQKLIMDVSSRITAKAANIRKSTAGDLADGEEKIVDLAILKSLVEIYAACHSAATKKLSAMSEQDQSGDAQDITKALDNVWANFDMRAAMLETLAQSLLPGSDNAATAGSAQPKVEAPSESTPEEKAPTEPAPTQEAPSAPPAAEEKATPAGNPMAMFAKPKNTEAAEKPAEAPSAPAPPPAETPAPKEEATEQPAAPAPAEEAPAKTETGGSPMSFFKKPEEGADE